MTCDPTARPLRFGGGLRMANGVQISQALLVFAIDPVWHWQTVGSNRTQFSVMQRTNFLRQFDSVFTEFETNASDEEVLGFAETRTARAFMLLGRVAGTFD